jgi:hypothetical protein
MIAPFASNEFIFETSRNCAMYSVLNAQKLCCPHNYSPVLQVVKIQHYCCLSFEVNMYKNTSLSCL